MTDCGVTIHGSEQAPPDVIGSAAPADLFWPAGLSFAQALDSARARDKEALSLLYRRFLPVVYRFLLNRVSDAPTAEDLTSETFFAVMSGIADVRARDELGFATWVLGIARNKLSQHYRSRQSAREVPLAFSDAGEPPAVAEESDPLATLVARERWEEVVAALNRLTSEQRAVLLHRLILGRSTENVAHMMGKPANAIYGLQFRALASLARYLRENESLGSAVQSGPRKGGTDHGA